MRQTPDDVNQDSMVERGALAWSSSNGACAEAVVTGIPKLEGVPDSHLLDGAVSFLIARRFVGRAPLCRTCLRLRRDARIQRLS